jgi:hypothetical protein
VTASPLTRSRMLKRIEGRIRRFASPRLQMAVMVAGTGVAGFFASVLLLHLGLHALWLRYGLAVGVAYVVFLLFCWLWILWRRGELEGGDVPDVADDAVGDILDALPQGGDAPAPPVPAEAPEGSSVSSALHALDLDEAIVLVAVAVAIAAALAGAVYLVVSAPAFFAELMLDGVLSAALYRRLRRIDQQHWLVSAAWRTGLLFLGVAVVFIILGAALHAVAPKAVSLGDVWRHVTGSPPGSTAAR